MYSILQKAIGAPDLPANLMCAVTNSTPCCLIGCIASLANSIFGFIKNLTIQTSHGISTAFRRSTQPLHQWLAVPISTQAWPASPAALLPCQIGIKIFAFLALTDIIRVTQVNRCWHRICNNRQLWAAFYRHHFHHHHMPDELLCDKKMFINRWITENNIGLGKFQKRSYLKLPNAIVPAFRSNNFNSIAFTANDQLIAIGGGIFNQLVRLWDYRFTTREICCRTFEKNFPGKLGTHGEQITLYSHEGSVTRLICSPSMDKLYSTSWDKTWRCWDLSNASQTTHQLNSCSAFIISKDGKELARATDNSIYLEDLVSNTTVLWENPTPYHIGALAFAPDKQHIYALTTNYDVIVIDKNQNSPYIYQCWPTQQVDRSVYVAYRPGHADDHTMRFSFNCDKIAICDQSGGNSTLYIWNLQTDMLNPIKWTSYIHCLAYSPDDKFLAIGSSWDISILNVENMKTHLLAKMPQNSHPTDIVFAFEGHMLAVSTNMGAYLYHFAPQAAI